jgi:hypothetical protein
VAYNSFEVPEDRSTTQAVILYDHAITFDIEVSLLECLEAIDKILIAPRFSAFGRKEFISAILSYKLTSRILLDLTGVYQKFFS